MAKVKTYYRPHRKSKSKRRRRRSLPVFSFPARKIFLVILAFAIFAGLGGHFYLQRQIEKLEAKKEELLLTKTRLSAKISRLKKDPKAYEEIARREYGLVKDNERLVIFR